MDAWFERRDSDDSWCGQPKYERLVMRGDDRFSLTARLPSGEEIEIPLGRYESFPPEIPPEPQP